MVQTQQEADGRGTVQNKSDEVGNGWVFFGGVMCCRGHPTGAEASPPGLVASFGSWA